MDTHRGGISSCPGDGAGVDSALDGDGDGAGAGEEVGAGGGNKRRGDSPAFLKQRRK